MDATTVAPSAVRSLSQPVPPWRITLATVIKGLQVARRYLPNLIGSFVGLAVRIVFFLLIANTASFGASGEQSISGRDLFLFFRAGCCCWSSTDRRCGGRSTPSPRTCTTARWNTSTVTSARYAYYISGADRSRDQPGDLCRSTCFHLVRAAGAVNMAPIPLVCAVVGGADRDGRDDSPLARCGGRSFYRQLGMLFEFPAARLPVSNFRSRCNTWPTCCPTRGYDLIRYYSLTAIGRRCRCGWSGSSHGYAVVFTLIRGISCVAEQYAKRSGLNII